MDPFGYYQPFLHCGLLLVEHYQLSYPETISMVAAMELVPNTCYFFALAAQTLLQRPANNLHPSHRGFAFGYLLASLMLDWRDAQSRQSPGIRWNLYRVPILASGEEWESRCKLKTLTCLRFYASFSKLVCKKTRKLQYKKLLTMYCSETPDCKVLTTNHMLAISSCLGLLPSWVRDKIEVSSSSWYMKWLAEEYHLMMTKELVQQIAESMRTVLTQRFGGYFSMRKVENILCKVYRRKNNNKSEERFCDLIFPEQMLFSGEGDDLVITYPGRRPPTRVRGALVGEWALGSETLSMEELIRSLGMVGNGLPSMREISAWTVPNALMFGRARRRMNYNLVHQVPVDCRCTLDTRFNELSRKLRLE